MAVAAPPRTAYSLRHAHPAAGRRLLAPEAGRSARRPKPPRGGVLRDRPNGRGGTLEVCDAAPYLKNAARFQGEPTDERCPVCRRDNLTLVHYIYGDELKQSAGQARKLAELPVLAMTLREFQVFVVEVCRSCSWNHLAEQYVLGRDALTADELDLGEALASSAAGRHRATGSSSDSREGR